MKRQEYMLAVLTTSPGATFSPVQVQKLFFLLDRELAAQTGGPYYNFTPYDYGPFDPAVYTTLEELAGGGYVEIDSTFGTRRRAYRLTESGQATGLTCLDQFQPEVRELIQKVSAWVRSLAFDQLVSAIYQRYPDMKARSVFRG